MLIIFILKYFVVLRAIFIFFSRTKRDIFLPRNRHKFQIALIATGFVIVLFTVTYLIDQPG